jgi:hypothetical protein
MRLQSSFKLQFLLKPILQAPPQAKKQLAPNLPRIRF